MKNKIKLTMKIIISIILFLGIFTYSNEVLKRKVLYGPWNYTIKVGGFYNLEKNSIDLMGFGSSHMYCSLDPKIMKEKANISSYVLATQQQSLEITYFYIKEALKRQSLDTVVVETFMMNRSKEYPSDAIAHDAIDFLPFSMNKLDLIRHAVPFEKRIEYYFPILKYHSRWSTLTKDDFDFSYKKLIDSDKGYVRLSQTQSFDLNLDLKANKEIELNKKDIYYLNKIVELSKAEDFRLVLVYAPYVMKQEDVNVMNSIEIWAKQNQIEFINGYKAMKQIKLDGNTDFYDNGHLNESGVKKFSEYMIEYLK